MDSKEALVVFEDKKVRRTWNNEEWWFVLEDIVYFLTDSNDLKQYIQKMKQLDEPLAKRCVQIVHTLALSPSGGKQKMNCVNTEGAYWRKLKQREPQLVTICHGLKMPAALKARLDEEGFELYDKIVQLKLPSADGKKHETDFANTDSRW